MYAVIQTGGKQYRAEPGKTIQVEKLPGDKGTPVVFDQVLLVSSGDGATVTIGKPTDIASMSGTPNPSCPEATTSTSASAYAAARSASLA